MRAFLAEQIFEPLGLRSTSADGIPTGANIARGQHEGQPLVSREIPTIVGTSDIWSTVGDLARFTTAVHSGSLLSLASQRTRLTAHTPLGGEGASDGAWMTDDGYGYGVFIGTLAGHTLFYHPGDVPGYLSFNAWLPNQGSCISVLANDDSTNIEHLLRQLLPIALNH